MVRWLSQVVTACLISILRDVLVESMKCLKLRWIESHSFFQFRLWRMMVLPIICVGDRYDAWCLQKSATTDLALRERAEMSAVGALLLVNRPKEVQIANTLMQSNTVSQLRLSSLSSYMSSIFLPRSFFSQTAARRVATTRVTNRTTATRTWTVRISKIFSS